MKNITVTVSDEIYRQARIRAAMENTTVSALVRKFLETPHEPSSRHCSVMDYMADFLDDEPDLADAVSDITPV